LDTKRQAKSRSGQEWVGCNLVHQTVNLCLKAAAASHNPWFIKGSSNSDLRLFLVHQMVHQSPSNIFRK